jgi:hypothetical protein
MTRNARGLRGGSRRLQRTSPLLRRLEIAVALDRFGQNSDGGKFEDLISLANLPSWTVSLDGVDVGGTDSNGFFETKEDPPDFLLEGGMELCVRIEEPELSADSVSDAAVSAVFNSISPSDSNEAESGTVSANSVSDTTQSAVFGSGSPSVSNEAESDTVSTNSASDTAQSAVSPSDTGGTLSANSDMNASPSEVPSDGIESNRLSANSVSEPAQTGLRSSNSVLGVVQSTILGSSSSTQSQEGEDASEPEVVVSAETTSSPGAIILGTVAPVSSIEPSNVDNTNGYMKETSTAPIISMSSGDVRRALRVFTRDPCYTLREQDFLFRIGGPVASIRFTITVEESTVEESTIEEPTVEEGGTTARVVSIPVPVFSPAVSTSRETGPPLISSQPSAVPSAQPSSVPSLSLVPSFVPSSAPTSSPSVSVSPSAAPSMEPSAAPSDSAAPSTSSSPSDAPSLVPSSSPSDAPSLVPSSIPTVQPSASSSPSDRPSLVPNSFVTSSPTLVPVEISQNQQFSVAQIAQEFIAGRGLN